MSVKISIITAVYNSEKTLEEALISMALQTYTNIEHIVIDGGSTDGSKDIIEKHRNKIAVYVSEPDKGIYDALNKGISKATGDVIGILHADDTFDNNEVLADIAKAFEKEQCDVLYGNLLYVSFEGKIIRYWKSISFDRKMLSRGWMPPHPTFFVKRGIFSRIGNYNMQYRIASDYDLMLRTLLLSDIKVFYLPQIITRMKVGGASNRSLKNIIRKSTEDYYIMKRNKVGGFYTLLMKNLSKVGQFFLRKGKDIQ
jgi:glycosyltransferase